MASDNSQSSKTLCKAGCGFFASTTNEGYCSLCWKSKNPQASVENTSQNETLNLAHLSARQYPDQKSISVPSSPNPNPSKDDDAKSTCSDLSLDRCQPVRVKKKKKKKRCKQCNIKLKPHQCIACRCGAVFCSMHRYPDEHNCQVDLIKHTRDKLQASNPVLKNKQMERIRSD